MDLSEWKSRNALSKYYSHFDKRVPLKYVWDYISTPSKVQHHGFYPFIHYQQKFNKYSKKNGVKPKTRDLCYAAHIDRYIYAYYAYLLNEQYNQRVIADKISDSAVAYRTDLHKSNVHFSKIAFDYIRSHTPCYIVVGDFTHFFDRLDHKYLKRQLCNLLECDSLPNDYYAVFKNITKYSTWNLESLLSLNNLPNSKPGIKKLNSYEQVLTPQQFKQYKKDNVTPNTQSYGIPQGSPISAILSNIYMLDFDKKFREYVNTFSGLYMRYSDDFIAVFPHTPNSQFTEQLRWIQNLIKNTNGLELQDEKTQLYYFSNCQLTNISSEYLEGVEKGKNILNYLGFSFDGQTVTIRDKTLSKYYYRMYRKARFIVKSKHYTKNKKRISNKNLYMLYSQKGAHQGNGNFLTYVQRSEKIFGKHDKISRGTKNHMAKIKKCLNDDSSI